LSQNIWELKGYLQQRQRRRAELARSLVKLQEAKRILDIGCAEGFATRFLCYDNNKVCALDIEVNNLKIAKKKVRGADFINASIEYLPFRQDSFDAVCILEVMEHLPRHLQEKGLREVNEVLSGRGSLLISIPYKENIIKTKCVHCGNITPMHGHLHSMDENYIMSLLPNDTKFSLRYKYRLPNLELISCSTSLEVIPFRLWAIINRVLGKIRKGYWMVLLFTH
jgi:2-polyprenyl-3-methyl-5-hydroxy-6-metoxy-1,4-benzoquinol methylase